MSAVMVLINESFRRVAREIAIFIEFSRLRDHTTRVVDISTGIRQAIYGRTCMSYISAFNIPWYGSNEAIVRYVRTEC